MGTAAAGAVVLGAAAGSKTFAPHITVAGEKFAIPLAGAKTAGPVAVPAQPTVGTIPSSWDYTADVVVVGDGAGGEGSAIAAYDAGASVLILEKAPKGLDGGNSGCCGGGVTVITPLTDFITVVNLCCYGVTPLDVITTFCTQTTNLANWMTSLGATMSPLDAFPTGVPPTLYASSVSPDYAYWNLTIEVPSISYPTKNQPNGTVGWGKDWWAFLDSCRASRGIPIMYQTPGKQLIKNPTTNEILGVVATNWTGQEINVRANKAVILACGGYENNREMQNNFAPELPKSEYMSFNGTPYNTGDGIYMAEQVGAKLWHMNKKEVHTFNCKAGSVELGFGLWVNNIGYGATGATTLPVIHVNRNGSRFMNEYCYNGHQDQTKEFDEYEEKYLASDGLNYSDWPNIPFYAIFDSKAMNSGPFVGNFSNILDTYSAVHNLYQWSQDNSAELAKGWIITADTPQDLAAKITCRDFYGNVVGMNAAGLAAQVTLWNNMCTTGTDTQFGRATKTLHPLTNPPFYAMELTESAVNTQGGPAHDKYSRTLDVNNNPIPRLYTVGELGSQWGALYYGGGNFCEALGMGQVAGTQAATLPSWTSTS